jgi:hypothetical protein
MTFTLRFPFQLQTGQEIDDAKSPLTEYVDGLTVSFAKQGEFYIFKIDGFASEEEAKAYISEIELALLILTINKDIAFNAEMRFDTVVYTDNPEEAGKNLSKSFGKIMKGPVDGLVNGNYPSVYPSNKRISTVTAGGLKVISSQPSTLFMNDFVGNLRAIRKKQPKIDAKLDLALDLFRASYYENSPQAKLLTLIMVIECLCPVENKSNLAMEFLSKWMDEIKAKMKSLDHDSDDFADLEALERELLFRKEKSISSRIRLFVGNILTKAGDPDVKAKVKRIMELYSIRSSLSHGKDVPITEIEVAANDARKIVKLILTAILLS